MRAGTILICLFLLFILLPARAAEPLAEWELHDSLGHAWSDELLYYEVDLKTPVAPHAPLSLWCGETAIPMQVVERKLNDAGQMTHCRLALLTSLPAFGQQRFRLLPVAAEPGPHPDLTVAQAGNRWLIGTSKIGVAIPHGDGSAQGSPALADFCPAPILSVHGAGDAWIGKGWLTGDVKVVSWKSEILASGPVFAWARVTYTFVDRKTWVFDIRVPVGQSVVLVREEGQCTGGAFMLAPGAGLKPNHVFSKRGLGFPSLIAEPATAFPAGAFLSPAQLHWLPTWCTIAGEWHEAENDPGDEPVVDNANDAPAIGLFPRFLTQWMPRTQVPVNWDKELGLVAQFNLFAGTREWALFAGTKGEMAVPKGKGGEGQFSGYTRALLLHTKWGETPLDKVKDWTLDWGDVRYDPNATYVRANIGRGTMPYFAEQFLQGGQHWHETNIHQHQCWTGEENAWEEYTKMVKTIPANQVLSARAGAAFTMYKQFDQDYWPSKNWIGPSNANMIQSGNSAMAKGTVALLDHPKAKEEWGPVSIPWLQKNLLASSTPDGAWLECPGYQGVGAMLTAALALRQAGAGDMFANGRFLAIAMFNTNIVTPPDPRFTGSPRHMPEMGDTVDIVNDRTGSRAIPSYWATLAPVYSDTHPTEMGQILWALGAKAGPVPIVPINGQSKAFDGFGVVMRHGFNTPRESYLAMHQSNFGYGHYHFDLSALHFFGKGAPLCVDWASMYTPQMSEAWWHNGITVNKIGRYSYRGRTLATGFLPRLDYSRSRVYYDAAAKPNADTPDDGVPATALPDKVWQRQVLFLKSADPAAATYLVVRDAVTDTRPTDWNLWTLSSALRLSPKRAEVTGLYGVDLLVDFFVGPNAAPTTETFGFGPSVKEEDPDAEPNPDGDKPVTRLAAPGVTEVMVPQTRFSQQNVVRMSSPAGGQYGAVLYPKLPGETPQITAGPEETVTVTVGKSSDLIFLYPAERTATVNGVTFTGRAGAASRQGTAVELHLSEGKAISIVLGKDTLGITGDGPVSAVYGNGQLDLRTDGTAREITLTFPVALKGQATGDGAIVTAAKGTLTLKVPAGMAHCVIR